MGRAMAFIRKSGHGKRQRPPRRRLSVDKSALEREVIWTVIAAIVTTAVAIIVVSKPMPPTPRVDGPEIVRHG
jgi:hypothetical protein